MSPRRVVASAHNATHSSKKRIASGGWYKQIVPNRSIRGRSRATQRQQNDNFSRTHTHTQCGTSNSRAPMNTHTHAGQTDWGGLLCVFVFLGGARTRFRKALRTRTGDELNSCRARRSAGTPTERAGLALRVLSICALPGAHRVEAKWVVPLNYLVIYLLLLSTHCGHIS